MKRESEGINQQIESQGQKKINNTDMKKVKNFFSNLKIEFTKDEDGIDQTVDFSNKEINGLHFTSLGKDIFEKYLDKLDLVAERFKENVKQFNISADKWKQAALKQPQLFYQSPETLNANVSKSSELMDIKKQDFIKAALKQPQLFVQSPETLNWQVPRILDM